MCTVLLRSRLVYDGIKDKHLLQRDTNVQEMRESET